MVEQCNLRPQLENKSLKETCRLDLQKIHEENAKSIGGVFTSGQRMGTAFKVCPKEDDCVFVSANHVTQGEKNISIQMPDGTKGKATLLGRDSKSDLSILSVKGQEKNTPQSPGAKLLPPLELVSKGDPVVGIGHADGRKIKSLSPGEIKTPDTPLGKGIRRDLAASGYPPPNLCHDAKMRAMGGQSGGPVFDRSGRVVGLISNGDKNDTCVIPSHRIKDLIDKLKKSRDTLN